MRQIILQIILQTSRYLLITAAVSFLGWLYEVLLVRIKYGHWSNRGFLWLPFCPIYGITLTFTYFLIGTPKEKRGILKRVANPYWHTALYLLFAFLIPTAAELLVGGVMETSFHITLWSYKGMAMNFRGYIALPISLLWMALIYMFMRFFFSPLQKSIEKIPPKITVVAASALLISTVIDATLQFMKM